jgi:hypothetical protein
MSQVSWQDAPATAAVAAQALPGNGIVEPDAAATAAPIRDAKGSALQSRHEVRPARMHFGALQKSLNRHVMHWGAIESQPSG